MGRGAGRQVSPVAWPGAFRSIAGLSIGVSSTSRSSALHWAITVLRYTWEGKRSRLEWVCSWQYLPPPTLSQGLSQEVSWAGRAASPGGQ